MKSTYFYHFRALFQDKYTHGGNKLDKVSSEGKTALQKPNSDNVVGERDGVVIILEGISVGQRYSKDGHVLVSDEAGKHFGQSCKSCNVKTQEIKHPKNNSNEVEEIHTHSKETQVLV